MKDFDSLKKVLKNEKEYLREEYKVSRIGVFGSYVRGEETEDSDLDILVDFDEPVSLFDLVEMENYLEDKLGVEVDLVTENSLKPSIRARVNDEVIYA